MYSRTGLLALAAYISAVTAASQGFNYGSTDTNGNAKTEADFIASFKTAKALVGTNGAFTSARLYTMLQGSSTTEVIQAIPAAISTGTRLLLGLWASGGSDSFKLQTDALSAAIKQYPDMAKLIDGISVGSEDLYRNSPADSVSEVGENPDVLAKYIGDVKEIIAQAGLKDVPVGHVDTSDAWTNATNSAVVDASDFLGVDEYPYWEAKFDNGIQDGKFRFDSALKNTMAVANGKPLWITETGWPVSGNRSNEAIPGATNAKKYWDDVGCGELFGQVNTWWFTLQDADPIAPNPSFGILPYGAAEPAFDLSCPA